MRIVVIDLDGVVFKSPSGDTISDHGYWLNFWNHPDNHEPNFEILDLARAFTRIHCQVLFLTARPTEVLDQTLHALDRHCFIKPNVCTDILEHEWDIDDNPYHLMMCDISLHEDDWQGSGAWKLDRIEELKVGHHVMFMIEDYKPNAEEIRKAIPVLLYEQRRRGD